ncbi:MAG: bifunctional 2-C-methyl-D-erythritol 4-phosphate cytidylyltransferase/2-C-methyl-D-erythritol 2,4-cyclodiphosphate synthase [Alphaproteobacteria bacterium]|nr:bifunctional 2-C-methyl-D-erythritol 4-phosphate cytidylyltransferase/2-C-methyl-D-erythritol 2,4-cyclodiphosphate synthase [Alphaproteobacteria bacterium]
MSEARVAALVMAAGRGQRLGGDEPKQYLLLGGLSVLARSLALFASHPRIDRVRAVIHADDRERYGEAIGSLKLAPPVSGGTTRQDSVRLGLESLANDPPDFVLIHDAARPLTPPSVIGRVIDALKTSVGAIPALPVTDTLKQGDGSRVTGTVPRAGLYRTQTPQGFRFAEILEAHRRFAGAELTDDAAVAEAAGHPVALVPGDEAAFKITTADDLERARRVSGETRIGTGFDVHRFGPGDHVWLCGIRVPHQRGLIGHSDADVGLHALTDAILGAIGAGDIGLHFPPSDPRWRGAPSGGFLAHAASLVTARGGRLVHADVTVICERPKVGPHRDAMRAAIAAILGIDLDRVSVKATTTEGLGFTGRGEGIAAEAVATVML